MRFVPLLCLLIWLPVADAVLPHASTCVATASPQSRGQKQTPQAGTIRVSTNLVQVPVSVSDSAGDAVKNLKLEDFTLEEDGKPVAINHLGEPGETRLEMILTFDLTGSVFAQFEFEKQAATGFLKSIYREGDSVSIFAIATRPIAVQARTTSLADALTRLNELAPSGASTSFYDTLIDAVHTLPERTDPDRRRVLVVLSDGEDNFSDHFLIDAVESVQQADCIFYSINPGGLSIRLNRVSLRGQEAMETIAAQTGGSAFLAEKLEELGAIFGRIAAELQAQYVLSYYSPDSARDGDFRRITVRVPGRPELRIRARQGYYASRTPSR